MAKLRSAEVEVAKAELLATLAEDNFVKVKREALRANQKVKAPVVATEEKDPTLKQIRRGSVLQAIMDAEKRGKNVDNTAELNAELAQRQVKLEAARDAIRRAQLAKEEALKAQAALEPFSDSSLDGKDDQGRRWSTSTLHPVDPALDDARPFTRRASEHSLANAEPRPLRKHNSTGQIAVIKPKEIRTDSNELQRILAEKREKQAQRQKMQEAKQAAATKSKGKSGGDELERILAEKREKHAEWLKFQEDKRKRDEEEQYYRDHPELRPKVPQQQPLNLTNLAPSPKKEKTPSRPMYGSEPDSLHKTSTSKAKVATLQPPGKNTHMSKSQESLSSTSRLKPNAAAQSSPLPAVRMNSDASAASDQPVKDAGMAEARSAHDIRMGVMAAEAPAILKQAPIPAASAEVAAEPDELQEEIAEKKRQIEALKAKLAMESAAAEQRKAEEAEVAKAQAEQRHKDELAQKEREEQEKRDAAEAAAATAAAEQRKAEEEARQRAHAEESRNKEQEIAEAEKAQAEKLRLEERAERERVEQEQRRAKEEDERNRAEQEKAEAVQKLAEANALAERKRHDEEQQQAREAEKLRLEELAVAEKLRAQKEQDDAEQRRQEEQKHHEREAILAAEKAKQSQLDAERVQTSALILQQQPDGSTQDAERFGFGSKQSSTSELESMDRKLSSGSVYGFSVDDVASSTLPVSQSSQPASASIAETSEDTHPPKPANIKAQAAAVIAAESAKSTAKAVAKIDAVDREKERKEIVATQRQQQLLESSGIVSGDSTNGGKRLDNAPKKQSDNSTVTKQEIEGAKGNEIY